MTLLVDLLVKNKRSDEAAEIADRMLRGCESRVSRQTGGEFSHCCVDSADLVKVSREWKVANFMWTVEKEDCPTAPSQKPRLEWAAASGRNRPVSGLI